MTNIKKWSALSRRLRWYRARLIEIFWSAHYAVRYSFRNLFSSKSVTATDGPVVSLTTHGDRIKTVYLAVESIGTGIRKPRRLLLFLDDIEAVKKPPASLQRLQARGLEILSAKNFGPHTKYYPFILLQANFFTPLVTADDDMLYPVSWLEDLYSAHMRDPSIIWCHRIRVIQLNDTGITSLHTWPFANSDRPAPLNFTEGVSGVIYPPEFLRCLQKLGTTFLGCCPKQDDAWINAVAIRMGFQRAQLSPYPRSYPEILGTATSGLWKHNHGSFGDLQIAKAFVEMGVPALTQPTSDV